MKESAIFNSPNTSVEAETEKPHLEMLIEILRNEETRLGEGQMAVVHHDPENPTYTYKVIRDTQAEKYRYPYNDAKREMQLSEEVRKYDTDQVRTPMHYGTFTVFGKKKIDVITMERIPGNSIKDVIEGSAQLPEGFDVELFFKKLSDHIDLLHENGLYHRDLHEGNIMFESETHMPVIIDFGNSASIIHGENPYEGTKANGDVIRFPQDKVLLESAKTKLITKMSEAEPIKRKGI